MNLFIWKNFSKNIIMHLLLGGQTQCQSFPLVFKKWSHLNNQVKRSLSHHASESQSWSWVLGKSIGATIQDRIPRIDVLNSSFLIHLYWCSPPSTLRMHGIKLIILMFSSSYIQSSIALYILSLSQIQVASFVISFDPLHTTTTI